MGWEREVAVLVRLGAHVRRLKRHGDPCERRLRPEERRRVCDANAAVDLRNRPKRENDGGRNAVRDALFR